MITLNLNDLDSLAWKFLDQCELTADQSQDDAIFLRMFLFRFLGFVRKEQGKPIVDRSHTRYCRLPAEHEGHCSMRGRGEVVQFRSGGQR